MKNNGMMRTMLAAGVVWMAVLTTGCGKEEGISSGMITTLSTGDFREKFNADGTVECAEPHYVYSSLSLPVKDVLVKEGDHVQAGDLLCVLDTESIEKEIALQQASMDVTQKNASTNVSAARREYNTYVEGINNGTDSNLVAAMANAEQARELCEAAQIRYANYKESVNLGMDPTITAADQAVRSAATSIQQAQSLQYEMEGKDYVTEVQKEQAEDAVDSAQLAYAQAIQRRENIARQSDLQLAAYAKDVDDAMEHYLSAVAAYQATVRNLENAKQASADAISLAMRSGDVSVEELRLAQLQENLLDAQILAEASGTITAVNVKEGENSTGVLFVIEDTSDLVLTARVSEKNINQVDRGMVADVTTKSDNSDVYEGRVTQISETAYKNAAGETDTTGKDADYKVTLDITEPDSRIRVGMNAKVSFVSYECRGCLTVPNEAVYTDENGESYILTVTMGEEGGTIGTEKISVIYKGKRESVVEGDGIADGTQVIIDGVTYQDLAGQTVKIL
ncbi:MAG: HlyD family efflux transporter periplasmic adaptor subunit [Lachnospiraceae bacterium]|nr:HlyD family efflux transporter periplasmic adaptor subunit [Lachnospiraceae bacterium]